MPSKIDLQIATSFVSITSIKKPRRVTGLLLIESERHLSSRLVAHRLLGDYPRILNSKINFVLIRTLDKLTMYANAVAALEALSENLGSLAVHFNRIELARAIIALLHVEVLIVNYREGGNLVAVLKGFQVYRADAFFADDLANNRNGSHRIPLGAGFVYVTVYRIQKGLGAFWHIQEQVFSPF